MSACVVEDHAIAGALENARAHHDVAPRGAEAVQTDDRRADTVIVEPKDPRHALDLTFHCGGS
jgi:hypothetical protein